MTNVDSPDPVRKDKPLTYSVTVRNAGPFGALGVTLTDRLPAGVTLSSLKTSEGSCRSAAPGQVVSVTCALGSLAAGSSAAVTIVVKRVPVGTIAATASAAATSPADPDTSNNSTTATTVVLR